MRRLNFLLFQFGFCAFTYGGTKGIIKNTSRMNTKKLFTILCEVSQTFI